MIIRGMAITLALCLSASAALADAKDDVLSAMVKCANTSGKAARLKCFDAASPALRALFIAPGLQGSLPQAAAPASSGRQAAEQNDSTFGLDFGGRKSPQTTPEEFGSETVAAPTPAPEAARPKEVDEIQARVTDYATTSLGKVIVFLDNGQVWRQMESDPSTLRLRQNPSDNTVVIKRGAFGSYSLIANKHGALIKVQRTK